MSILCELEHSKVTIASLSLPTSLFSQAHTHTHKEAFTFFIYIIHFNPCAGTMKGGRLHTYKSILKMSQNLRNGYHLVSLPAHGLIFLFKLLHNQFSFELGFSLTQLYISFQ